MLGIVRLPNETRFANGTSCNRFKKRSCLNKLGKERLDDAQQVQMDSILESRLLGVSLGPKESRPNPLANEDFLRSFGSHTNFISIMAKREISKRLTPEISPRTFSHVVGIDS